MLYLRSNRIELKNVGVRQRGMSKQTDIDTRRDHDKHFGKKNWSGNTITSNRKQKIVWEFLKLSAMIHFIRNDWNFIELNGIRMWCDMRALYKTSNVNANMYDTVSQRRNEITESIALHAFFCYTFRDHTAQAKPHDRKEEKKNNAETNKTVRLIYLIYFLRSFSVCCFCFSSFSQNLLLNLSFPLSHSIISISLAVSLSVSRVCARERLAILNYETNNENKVIVSFLEPHRELETAISIESLNSKCFHL